MSAALRLGVGRAAAVAPGRTALRVAVLALAAALLGAMLLFIGNSLRTMTGERRLAACRSTGRARSPRYGAGAQRRRRRSPAEPGVAAGVAGRDGAVRRASATAAPAGTIRTGAGSVLAVPPGYLRSICRRSASCTARLRPGEVVLDQQLAATLRAQVGDTVTLTPGARAQRRSATASAASRSSPRPTCSSSRSTPSSARRPRSRPRRSRSCRSGPSPARYAPALPTLTPAARRQPRRCPAPRTASSGRCRRRSTPTALGGIAERRRCKRAGQIRNRVERDAAPARCSSSTTSRTA